MAKRPGRTCQWHIVRSRKIHTTQYQNGIKSSHQNSGPMKYNILLQSLTTQKKDHATTKKAHGKNSRAEDPH
jgi:transposase